MLAIKFWFIWPCSFRGEDLIKLANQKQELPLTPSLLTDQDDMSNLDGGPSINAF
jgi:hypothetical protein